MRGGGRRQKDAIVVHAARGSDVGLGPGLHIDRSREVGLLHVDEIGLGIEPLQGCGRCTVGPGDAGTIVLGGLLRPPEAIPVQRAAVERRHVSRAETSLPAVLDQRDDRPSLGVLVGEAVGVVREEELDDLDR